MTSTGEMVGLRAETGSREKIGSMVREFKIPFPRSPCNSGSGNNLLLKIFHISDTI